MINRIIMGIISLISGLIGVILSPIDTLISSALPGLSNALTNFASLLNVVGQGIGWVISALAIPTEIISLIIAYWVFKLSVPVVVYTIKLVVKWYDKLKL